MLLPPYIIDGIIIWGYAERCVGFCLVIGLVFLIYKLAYKALKQSPPEPNNDQQKAETAYCPFHRHRFPKAGACPLCKKEVEAASWDEMEGD